MRGHYARLWHMGVWVDFLDAQQVLAGQLNGYNAAILPVPLALDAGYFSHLADYVRDGGMLISDACPGRFDRFGFSPRAQMVHGGEAVFGVCHERVRIVREPADGSAYWTPHERVWGDFLPASILDGAGLCARARLRASFFVQTLKLTTAETILSLGGETVGSFNTLGNGSAVLLGTFAGHGFGAHPLDEPENLFNRLLAHAGVQGEVYGQLLRRRRVLGKQEAWFFINIGPGIAVERIPLSGRSLVADLLEDTVVDSDGSTVSVQVGPYSVDCLVLTS